MQPADLAKAQLIQPDVSARLAFLDVLRNVTVDHPLAASAKVRTVVAAAAADMTQDPVVRDAARQTLTVLGGSAPAVRSAPAMRASRLVS